MATIYDLSVRRPVLATVLSLAIVIAGVIGFLGLGVREYPIIETPVISVSTSLRGANAEVIQNQVTEPIEESVNGISGVRSITSTSRDGSSNINVEFELGADLDASAAEVRDRVSRARGRIPAEADEPVVSKSNADANPVVFLNVSSESRNLLELTDLARSFFVERLQTIDGVASVDIWGEKRYAMRLYLDPARMAAYGLTPTDVRAAVTSQNVELPGGRIEGDQVDLTIRPLMRLTTPADFENLTLKTSGATLVRLGDVGRVALGAQNERTLLKRDGVPMVGVVLRPLPGANYVQMVDEFYVRLEAIRRDLPADVETNIGFDNTRQIRASILEVEETVLIAIGLVVLVIFVFLRDWRSTLIPILVIPVSLVGSFAIMAVAGFSINVLTLLALVLAIGLVVDDAIVVLENIYGKIEEGMPPRRAAVEGTREIFVAVIATTAALVVVFLPIIFQGGVVGALFREFGITLAGAILISAFVALTLTPMLASRLLKKQAQHPWLYRKTEPFFQRLNDGYKGALDGFLRVRWMAFVVMAVCAGLVYLLINTIESELAPAEDRAQISVSAQAPQGRGFAYTQAYTERLEALVRREVPEATGIIAIIGGGGGGTTNSGRITVTLGPAGERERTQDEIAQSLQKAVRTLPGAAVNVQQPATITTASSRGLPVSYVIQAPTLDALQETLPEFMAAVEASGMFAFARANLEFTQPELEVEVDRARAQTLGIDPLDVAQTLQVALSEQRLGYFIREGQQYEIIAQLENDRRNQPSSLRSLFVKNAAGTPILLENLVTIREGAAPPQLTRYNRFEAATVNAQPAPGVTLGAALDEMDRIADEVLPDGFTRTVTGQSRDFRESSGSLYVTFGLALILIYLVLAGQFESFRDPFIVLLTVPLALAGALGFLWYFDATLNVFSQIGLVMLVGLVTKNGILIVEFANQKRLHAGASIQEAAREGAAARFRPILMTSLATILGTLPIALALGAGAESRVPMGLAVIGGLTVGTLLTLFVIPAVYTYLAPRRITDPDAADLDAPKDAPVETRAEADVPAEPATSEGDGFPGERAAVTANVAGPDASSGDGAADVPAVAQEPTAKGEGPNG